MGLRIVACAFILVSYSVVSGVSAQSEDDVSLSYGRRVWWKTNLYPAQGIYTAGRMTERQLKVAVDGGFRSVLAIFPANTSWPVAYPDDAKQRHLLVDVSGIQYDVMFVNAGDLITRDTVVQFGVRFKQLRLPILVQSYPYQDGVLLTLAHLATRSRATPDLLPHVNSQAVYKKCAVFGVSFPGSYPALIHDITGEEIPSRIPSVSEISAPVKDEHWWYRPVYGHWYTSGQITRRQVANLQNAGFRSVLNVRRGVTYEGQRSQEAAFLLNIRDGTPTYHRTTGERFRQSRVVLLKTRINPNVSNEFIGLMAADNFESSNPAEYGDELGYNETQHRTDHFRHHGNDILYSHMPIHPGTNELGRHVFEQYRPVLLGSYLRGDVLINCASGTRAVYMAVLSAAYQNRFSLDWAMEKLDDLGFGITPQSKWYLLLSPWLRPAGQRFTLPHPHIIG